MKEYPVIQLRVIRGVYVNRQALAIGTVFEMDLRSAVDLVNSGRVEFVNPEDAKQLVPARFWEDKKPDAHAPTFRLVA